MPRILTFVVAAFAAQLLLGLCANPAVALRQLRVSATIAAHDAEPFTDVTPRVTAKDQNGRAVKGVRCVFTWHLKTATPRAIRYTNAAGVARHTRTIGKASSGYRVWVTVKCAWRGQVKNCRTWFVPGQALPSVPKIVFIGDSISAGFYASTEADSFRGRVRARFVCTSDLVSVYGWLSEDVDLTRVIATAGDIVVVEVGTNDASRYPGGVPVDPVDFEANLRAIADAARTGNPACRLIFLSVWQAPPTRAPFDVRIAAVATDYGRHFVDLSSIKDEPANSMPGGVSTYLGVSDGWHPNDAGHRAIAAAVGQMIAKLLGQDTTTRGR